VARHRRPQRVAARAVRVRGRVAQRLGRVQPGADGVGLLAREPVERPRRRAGLRELRQRGRRLAVARPAQLLRQPLALGHEVLERHRVQPVHGGFELGHTVHSAAAGYGAAE
jgi:hypothetical protein